MGLLAVTLGCSSEARSPYEFGALRHSPALVAGSHIVVFPLRGKSVQLTIPVPLGIAAISPDGLSLYGVEDLGSGGGSLVRVDLGRRSVEPVKGGENFKAIFSLAVSNATLLVSGTLSGDTEPLCGLYASNRGSGIWERLAGTDDSDCIASWWSGLSVTSEGNFAAGTLRRGVVGVIDVRGRRIARTWAAAFLSWSPNGQWLVETAFSSAMDMALLDPTTYSVVRTLGSAGQVPPLWSPDSSHLVLWRSSFSCGISAGYTGSLDIIEVKSGRAKTIGSSECQVGAGNVLWVADSATNTAKD